MNCCSVAAAQHAYMSTQNLDTFRIGIHPQLSYDANYAQCLRAVCCKLECEHAINLHPPTQDH